MGSRLFYRSPIVQVDDSDPNIIYTGDWFVGGHPIEEFDGTIHAALTNGSKITYSFEGIPLALMATFLSCTQCIGTSITSFGTIPGSPPSGSVPITSSFSLDGLSAVLVTVPKPLETIYRHAFYVSPELEDGEHTLVITVINTDPNDQMWFDYFEYSPSTPSIAAASTPYSIVSTPKPVLPSSSSTATPPNLTPPNTLSGTSSSSVSTDSSLPTILSTEPSVSNPVVSDTGSLSLTSSIPNPTVSVSSASTHHHLHTILPAVLVPIILVLLIFPAFLLWHRRRAQRKRYDEQQGRVDIDGMTHDTSIVRETS
ncbi:hypothetical protein C8Q75DRAFT_806917 [Abortiporus biennis]|nr:hypothetical protein C8Q75DRAFT_806917 [Abortiporus biennis]